MLPVRFGTVQNSASDLIMPGLRQLDPWQLVFIEGNDPGVGKCQQDGGMGGNDKLRFTVARQVIHER